jgi:hypothetical protein
MVNTNTARIGFAYVMNVGRPQRQRTVEVWNGRPYQVMASPTRGNGAFVYVPPAGGEVQTFDYVSIRPRKGGFKVKFGKDHFKEMSGINVIFEGPSLWVLSEPMAYELYRLAGNPAGDLLPIRMADFGPTGMDGLDGSFELEMSETLEPGRDRKLLVGFVDQGARPLVRVLLVKGHKFAFVGVRASRRASQCSSNASKPCASGSCGIN